MKKTGPKAGFFVTAEAVPSSREAITWQPEPEQRPEQPERPERPGQQQEQRPERQQPEPEQQPGQPEQQPGLLFCHRR